MYIDQVVWAVERNLHAEILALMEVHYHERPDGDGGATYWERQYIVAWHGGKGGHIKYGTHKVCIDSRGDSMCIDGHYCGQQRQRALQSFVERSTAMRMVPERS